MDKRLTLKESQKLTEEHADFMWWGQDSSQKCLAHEPSSLLPILLFQPHIRRVHPPRSAWPLIHQFYHIQNNKQQRENKNQSLTYISWIIPGFFTQMKNLLKIKHAPLISFYIFLTSNGHINMNESPQDRIILCSLPYLIFICTLKISLLAWIGFWICVLLTRARVYNLDGENCANGFFYL